MRETKNEWCWSHIAVKRSSSLRNITDRVFKHNGEVPLLFSFLCIQKRMKEQLFFSYIHRRPSLWKLYRHHTARHCRLVNKLYLQILHLFLKGFLPMESIFVLSVIFFTCLFSVFNIPSYYLSRTFRTRIIFFNLKYYVFVKRMACLLN